MKTVYEIRDKSNGWLYRAPHGCRFVFNKMKNDEKIPLLRLLADLLKTLPEEAKNVIMFEVIYNDDGEEVKKWLVWDERFNSVEDIETIINFSI